MNLNLVQGHKYDPARSLADVKKCVIADIEAAVAAGDLPAEYTYAVRAYRDVHKNVEVTVRGMEQGDIYEPDDYGHNRYTAKAMKVCEWINGIMAEYNRTNDDIQSDYFNRHLWTDVKLEDSQGRAWREQNERLAAEKKTLRAALKGLGITDFKVSTTGRRRGVLTAWVSLPLEWQHKQAEIEAAGLSVHVGRYSMAVMTAAEE